MTSFSANLIGHTLKAATVGAILMLSATASQAQSASPFAGFDGAWSGSGTVSLSDGSSEQIRCRATYNVVGGTALKQSLRCASDSYKFELSSDVKSQGNQVTGTWGEASRNIFGNLQGSAGGGQIDVFVEAAGFAANLTLTTKGNKQLVSISSKGQIRDVSINMIRS
ncbi:hypothetical protein [Tardiphaga sp. P9-11]|jgi:hypothetical protein|uniref:hypothetical protein n=1 Tax=Tardiphaga sp. P9-11 TaxID=2024614 RepID=UPI0011F09DC7|nr:hypothetical protein [Tardiphaga sp. P9-11]KAA0078088.1 hypothetical protein CIW50_03395 [Tardiphaga sp. P9-11]